MAHQLAVIQPPTSRQAAIDEYGELSRRIEEFEPVVKRHKELKDEIRCWYDNAPADETAIAKGRLYHVQVGEREWQRKIVNMGALFKLVGVSKFVKHCSFPIAAMDKLVPIEKLGGIVVKAQTGLRSVKSVPRGQPAG